MCASGTLRIKNCHCEERSDVAISRKGHLVIKPTQDTFVLAWRKKAHTSKRVSIIACNNVISKAQCATHSRFLTLVIFAPFRRYNTVRKQKFFLQLILNLDMIYIIA